MVAARMALTRRVSAGRTIWRLGGGCGRADICIPAFVRARIWRKSASAPNDADDEPVYPGTCRDRQDVAEFREPAGVNWRFRVPEGEAVEFADLNLGRQTLCRGQ